MRFLVVTETQVRFAELYGGLCRRIEPKAGMDAMKKEWKKQGR